ncbi:MAG: hypothetical protein LBB83_08470 [Treponema sp.]|jgi:hypothetical protein|nr:hypothetical protein [Treponema sp.]
MKKLLCTAIIFVLIGMVIFAQESGAEEQQPAQPTEQAQPEQPSGGPPQAASGVGATMGVNMGPLGMGTLSIDGMVLAGARARGAYQDGWAKDGNWALEGVQAVWEENRFDLYLNYSFRNYGAFLGLRAQNYGPNAFDYNAIIARYAFIYADFGKAKVSVGKLYDEILSYRDSRVWKSTGPGDSHRFTDDESYSVRLELKPIEGLNVGLQWFFPAFDGYLEGFRVDGRDSISGYYVEGMDKTDAWKELGLGAQYSNDLFDIQAGIRFDSKVDRYNKLDTGPQGKGTYLSQYYGSTSLLAKGVDAGMFLNNMDMTQGDRAGMLPKYKHLDKITENVGFDMSTMSITGDWLPYGDGHYAFFGFNFKGVSNLTARGHGGLYNLGAFNEFGYGRVSEEFKLDKIAGSKFGAGIVMQQEFYGNDVFLDNMVNSPFLQFGPRLTYDLITNPYMPMPMLQARIEADYGICQDVVDAYVKVKPVLAVSLGALMADLFYEIEYTGFKDSTGIKPITRHTIGLGAMLLF